MLHHVGVITIHLKYEIDADKLEDFEEYGRRWVGLVNRFGGTHHGYFLPSGATATSPTPSSPFPASPRTSSTAPTA